MKIEDFVEFLKKRIEEGYTGEILISPEPYLTIQNKAQTKKVRGALNWQPDIILLPEE